MSVTSINKPKTLSVIVVDPHFSLMHVKSIDNSLAGLQGAIDDHHIELVIIDDDNIMYIDEEGLFRDNQAYFVINGKERKLPIAGKSIILGNDMEHGETKDVKMSLIDAANLITFHTRDEMYTMSQAGEF